MCAETFSLLPAGVPLLRSRTLPVSLLIAALLAGCATTPPPTIRTVAEGRASWYGDDFHGRTTSSGERYNMYRLTAASRDIPLGTQVRVTRLDTGKSVTVLVNDRGPFVEGRIIDLSYEAAWRLDMLETGVAMVRLDVLSGPGQPIQPTTAPVASRPATTPGTATSPAAPAVMATPTAGATYWVSLGAFTLERNAIWLRNRISSQIPTAAVHQLGAAPSPLYQVRIGPHPSMEEAERTRRLLEELGLRGSLGQETTP